MKEKNNEKNVNDKENYYNERERERERKRLKVINRNNWEMEQEWRVLSGVPEVKEEEEEEEEEEAAACKINV